MAFLATSLALSFLTLAPQGGGEAAQEKKPILSSSEQKSLNKKTVKWFAADAAYDNASSRNRERASRKAQSEKEKFLKEWESRSRKGNLLASVADLRAIFDKVFEYGKQSGTGSAKLIRKDSEIPEHTIVVPKGYRESNSYRAVLLVPTYDKDKGWTKGRDYFGATWDGSKTHTDAKTFFHIPHIDSDIDLDPRPNFGKPGEDEKEVRRIFALLKAFGESQRNFRLDRQRVILDCGDGSSGFGLRMVANFPDRFAGLILRSPIDVGDLRLGSLTGFPVMMITSDKATEDAAAKIKTTLDGLEEGFCTVIKATDAYPFKAATAQLDEWVAGVERNLFRKKVVLEPNDDRFRKGYWVEIGRADQIHTLAPEDRPRIEVTVDSAANRITVKTTSIEDFSLMLNDELVDLDKEFTVVINDKAFTEKRERNLNYMVDLIGVRRKFDTNFLFTTSFAASVPKTEADNNGK